MAKFKDFSSFNGKQVILTSGRLIFNARDENLFLLSKGDISISTGGDLHIDVGVKGQTTSKLIVNSPLTQFGLGPDMESVAKGDSVVASFNELITELSKLLSTLTSAKGLVNGGTATLTEINIAASAFNQKLPSIQKDLQNILSKITFTN